MPRLKALSVLAGIVAVLVVSTTPASAWWKSTQKPAQTQGPITVLTAGKFVDKGATTECPASEIKAQWYLQTKGQIKEHQKNEKQEPATEGPHLNIQVKWGNKPFNCKTKAAVLPEAVATNVSPCELQLVQQKGAFTATGGVVTGCVITIGEGATPLCVLQIPPGMEKQPGSNEGINVGLTSVILSNPTAEKQLDEVEVTAGGTGQLAGSGVYVVQQPGHLMCPVGTNEEAELKELKFEAGSLQAF